MSTEKPDLIYQAIPAIMAEIPAILKDRKNSQQNYSFRGIDDVYQAVNPILAKHRVFMRSEVQEVKREERLSKSGGVLSFVTVRVRYFFVASDGSSVFTDAVGEGMDAGDKATPKAMSIAQKYAILQMFCIPTEEPKDPENDNPEPAPRPRPVSPTATPKVAPAVVHAPKSVHDEFDLSDPLDEAAQDPFIEAKEALAAIGIGEEMMWRGIQRKAQEKFGHGVTEWGEFTEIEKTDILGYLSRWRKARQAEVDKEKKS